MERFSELARKEVGRLLGYIQRRLGSVHDADDLLQEVLLALWRQLDVVGPLDHPVAWLYRTAANKIADELRRRYRAAGSRASDLELSDLWELADAEAESPREEAQRRELRDAIFSAIRELPPEQRDVLLWHEVEGMTFDEMHARTGVPINTLISRKRYAVLKLRKVLSKPFPSHEEET